MRSANIYRSGNGVERVPTCSTAEPLPWWLDAEPAVTLAATEPVESLAGPCPTCGCAVGWKLPAGRVLCAACNPCPADAAKVLFVDDGQGWVDYAAERDRHEQRHEATDDWSDGEPWTADTWHCPKCRSAASWLSMADVRHCMNCEPPRRAERVQRFAASVRRRFPVGTEDKHGHPHARG